MSIIIGVKELRNRMSEVSAAVAKGQSFTVVNRSRPIFVIQKAPGLDEWGDMADEYDHTLDLQDSQGHGLPLKEFIDILQDLDHKNPQHERQSPKVSG